MLERQEEAHIKVSRRIALGFLGPRKVTKTRLVVVDD